MKPVDVGMTNFVYKAPANWDEAAHGPCIDLPVHQTDDPYIMSWWKPATFKEWWDLVRCKPIRLTLVSSTLPPVSLEVNKR